MSASIVPVVCAVTSTAAPASSGVTSAAYGTTAKGEAVQVFTLTNAKGMSVKVLDYGGAIIEVMAPDRSGKRANVVLAVSDLKTLEANGSLNTLIGRYANRIKGGFSLDGKHYTLPANAKGVTLHGGAQGYNSRVWKAETANSRSGPQVKLSLVSPDGDQGFPGTLAVSVTYTLTDTNDLRLDYEAMTDKPTVVTLTNHAYFNLGGNGSGSVEDHRLQIIADAYTPTDEDQVPIGVIAPVAGTPFDFRAPKRIGADLRSPHPQLRIGRGYDHNFVLRKQRGVALPLAARLYDPRSGRTLDVRTTEPGLQIYSGNHQNGSLLSAVGTTVRQTDSIALETQHFPNSPNLANFPTTVLRPGQVLRSTTSFHFGTDKDRKR